MELEMASKTSLLRLFLASQPSPTEGPRGQDVSQGERQQGLDSRPAMKEASLPCPAPESRRQRAPHLEHLDHILAVALLSQVTQLGCDVDATADVHVHLHGLLLDLGVQLCQILYQGQGKSEETPSTPAGTDKASSPPLLLQSP